VNSGYFCNQKKYIGLSINPITTTITDRIIFSNNSGMSVLYNNKPTQPINEHANHSVH